VDRYCDLASTCEELEQLSEAVECYAKALAILEVMAKARKDPELVREQIELYEKLGDIYKDGKLVTQSIPRALEFYDLAASGGCATAKTKSASIKEKRHGF
jgi:TPR repeat protein